MVAHEFVAFPLLTSSDSLLIRVWSELQTGFWSDSFKDIQFLIFFLIKGLKTSFFFFEICRHLIMGIVYGKGRKRIKKDIIA